MECRVAERGRIVLAMMLAVATAWAGVLLSVPPASAQPVRPIPTFARDVAPIFFTHCTTCHRPGQIAPMSLLTYKDARPWSRSIRARVAARTMPPWFADDGHRPLAGDRRLNDNELMTILAWVDGGAVEGNPADLPREPAHAQDDWQIGTADAVFELPDEYPIPASGPVAVQYFEVPTNFTEDKWVQAIEVRPGDQARVHKVLLYHRDSPLGAGANPDDESAPPGRALTFYASGADPLVFADGMAARLPAGSVLVFEVHYTTNGSIGRDRTRLGLRFARQPPALAIQALSIRNTGLVIPPGESNHRVRASVKFDEPVSLVSVVPHAHRRGRSYQYRLLHDDGRAETILSVSRYNWLWESAYRFAEPVAVPARTTIEVTAVFDNSAANKANPDPRRAVTWGWDPATHEMMLSFVVLATPRSP